MVVVVTQQTDQLKQVQEQLTTAAVAVDLVVVALVKVAQALLLSLTLPLRNLVAVLSQQTAQTLSTHLTHRAHSPH